MLLGLLLGTANSPCSLLLPLLPPARRLRCLGTPLQRPSHPAGEWKLPGTGSSQGPRSAQLGFTPGPGWEGTGSTLAQQPTAASSFTGYMFVFKFLKPLSPCTPVPAGPRPAFASFLPLLDQAGLLGGAPGQASLSCCPPARA